MVPTFPCPVYTNAKRIPHADAIRWTSGGRSVSWEYLSHYVSATVRHIKEFGIKRSDCIGFAVDPGPSLVIMILALWRMGVAACLLDKTLSDTQLAQMAQSLHLGLLITDKKRKVRVRQALIDDTVTIEVVKDFWYASEESAPQLDGQSAAVVVWKDENSDTFSLEEVLNESRLPEGKVIQLIVRSLRTGEAVALGD